ncbi:hypothetical protein H1R20_g3126, partial [Candolleomyces eurysporus]
MASFTSTSLRSIRLAQPPQFAHLPNLLNADGSKMSKRNDEIQADDCNKRVWEAISYSTGWHWPVWPPDMTHSPNRPNPSLNPLQHTPINQAPMLQILSYIGAYAASFDLTSVTHRNSTLDPMKLEYLNKQHLLQQHSTSDGLTATAQRVRDLVKDAFPESQHTSVEMIEKAILLEGRLTNLKEPLMHAFYLFEVPDLGSEEVVEMVNALDPQDRELVLSSVSKGPSEVPEPWENQDMLKVLHDTRKEIKVRTKVFIKTLRHALTGVKSFCIRLPFVIFVSPLVVINLVCT